MPAGSARRWSSTARHRGRGRRDPARRPRSLRRPQRTTPSARHGRAQRARSIDVACAAVLMGGRAPVANSAPAGSVAYERPSAEACPAAPPDSDLAVLAQVVGQRLVIASTRPECLHRLVDRAPPTESSPSAGCGDRPVPDHQRARGRGRPGLLRLLSPALGLHRVEARRGRAPEALFRGGQMWPSAQRRRVGNIARRALESRRTR